MREAINEVQQDAALAPAWTIQRILVWSTHFLSERGCESPRLDAELLLAATLKLTRMQLYTSFDQPLSPAEREPFKDLLRRRAAGEPVAYITGVKEFFSLPFQVSRDVLIPRPDTEVLVERALSEVKRRGCLDGSGLRLLDIGTGSGCVALTLARRLPGAQVIAWDISEPALAVATANSKALNINNILFVNCDALDEASWCGEAVDIIVSNPPYIGFDERASLPVSVEQFEPELALFAAQAGLQFYQVFARHARQLLKADGLLLAEIGASQGPAVRSVFEQAAWRAVEVHKDYAKLDRVVGAYV